MSRTIEGPAIDAGVVRTWTEAPFSVSLEAPISGRHVRFTIRGESGADVVPKLERLTEYLAAQTVRAPDGAVLCPVHGARMQESKFKDRGVVQLFCPAKTGDGDGRCQYTAPKP